MNGYVTRHSIAALQAAVLGLGIATSPLGWAEETRPFGP